MIEGEELPLPPTIPTQWIKGESQADAKQQHDPFFEALAEPPGATTTGTTTTLPGNDKRRLPIPPDARLIQIDTFPCGPEPTPSRSSKPKRTSIDDHASSQISGYNTNVLDGILNR